MSTQNIQFHDKIFVFFSYWKNFVGTQKRVRLSHEKRANGVRAIAVRLYPDHFAHPRSENMTFIVRLNNQRRLQQMATENRQGRTVRIGEIDLNQNVLNSQKGILSLDARQG